MDILFFIGIALVCGFIGGKLAKLIKLPSVVGYLLAGLLLGNSVFNLFSLKVLDRIGIFSDFALGIVAFIIGSEMRISVIRKLGKGILTILLGESLGAVLLVTLGVYLLTRQFHIALIFGALAAATAPAGTVAVLQEYKSKGTLTSTIYAIVGLDDGVAVVIYVFVAAFVKMFLIGSSISLIGIIKGPVIEILGSIL